MKKIILSAIMLLGLVSMGHSQEIAKNALGIRVPVDNGFGGETSYQRGLSKNNRLEFVLGLRDIRDYYAIKGLALYEWVWNLKGDFNWYVGAGAGITSWDYDGTKDDDSGTSVLAAGDIGIEYGFKKVPLLLSFDARPEIGSGNYDDDNFGFDVGIGVKFKF